MIPVTSSMCLGRPPGQPIPKKDALEDQARQKLYLQARPPLRDLVDVWAPWSWALLNDGPAVGMGYHGPKFNAMTEESVRSQCLLLHEELVKLVEARPEEEGAETQGTPTWWPYSHGDCSYKRIPATKPNQGDPMKRAKKKVIALVVDTDLTNEQIEQQGIVFLEIVPRDMVTPKQAWGQRLEARNVRVLDSD